MKYFTPKEIAEYCGVNKVTPIKWINDGDLPAIKREKPHADNSKSLVRFYYYVSENDLRDFLEKSPKYAHVIDVIWPKHITKEYRLKELDECLNEIASLQEQADHINKRLSFVRDKIWDLIKAENEDH